MEKTTYWFNSYFKLRFLNCYKINRNLSYIIELIHADILFLIWQWLIILHFRLFLVILFYSNACLITWRLNSNQLEFLLLIIWVDTWKKKKACGLCHKFWNVGISVGIGPIWNHWRLPSNKNLNFIINKFLYIK